MMDRRKFILRSSLASAGLLASRMPGFSEPLPAYHQSNGIPVVISTWDFGLMANQVAWEILSTGARSIDAVEAGIRLIEADPENSSVGIGGLPDREGRVTLDASIMDENGNAGSVTFLQHIKHPISVARLVMETTPHVMLSGEGALQFALANGFQQENLLTGSSEKAWEEWKGHSLYKPVINIENHDTIGLLAIDMSGRLSGGCSTSGLAYKMHGRVGDSPIIGAGLFVDNDIGAAVATGLGELMMKTLSAFLVVELMRSGKDPQDACDEALWRIVRKYPEHKDHQVGILGVDTQGQTGASSLKKGFTYAITKSNEHILKEARVCF